MKQRKIVSIIGALVLIISAAVLVMGCPQSNNGKNNDNNNGGYNNGGNNGGNNSPKYTIYLKNASSEYAITFWYAKEIDNEDNTYYSKVRINPGETGYISNIPGNKKYTINSKAENLYNPSDWTAKWLDELYLDEDKHLVVH